MTPSSQLFEKTVLFTGRSGGYETYRIPALVMTTRGSLLAFCAARKEASDWAHIDIAMRRSSSDGARTWEPPCIVASESGSTVDNPVPIIDHMTGAVHFLYQVNYERCLLYAQRR